MTARGRTLAFLAVSMLVFGRLLGMRELVMAGGALGLVLGFGLVAVWARAGTVAVQRTVRPSRTTAGRRVRVELRMQGQGRLGVGPVLLTDHIPARLGRSVPLALAGGRRARAVAYTMTPRLRGRYQVGPLEVTHTDPFGAVRRTRSVPGRSVLTVYPSFEEISVLPSGRQRLGVVRHSPLVGSGDEFYALRPYEEGDDLRKLHWPSSIRLGHLVVRQEELLAEPRALVILDNCRDKHTGRGATASLEAAVSACASVGALALHRRMRLDVVTADGLLVRNPSREQLLEALALLQASPAADLTQGLRRTRVPAGRVAVCVVITPRLRGPEATAVALLSRRAAGGAVVRIDAETFRRRRLVADRGDDLAVLDLPLVPLGAQDSFRQAWHTGLQDVALAR